MAKRDSNSNDPLSRKDVGWVALALFYLHCQSNEYPKKHWSVVTIVWWCQGQPTPRLTCLQKWRWPKLISEACGRVAVNQGPTPPSEMLCINLPISLSDCIGQFIPSDKYSDSSRNPTWWRIATYAQSKSSLLREISTAMGGSELELTRLKGSTSHSKAIWAPKAPFIFVTISIYRILILISLVIRIPISLIQRQHGVLCWGDE